MNQLTNEEKEKIFTMYWGQRVLKFSKTAPATQYVNGTMLSYAYKNNECCLELTPISSITDEDARQVCVMELPLHEPDSSPSTKEWIEKDQFNLSYPTFMFLISKGYNVPLYFAPKHWANSKTAIELGIAIEKK